MATFKAIRIDKGEGGQTVAFADFDSGEDSTYVEMKGAPHYLEGHRPEALARVAEWMRSRFP